MQPLPAKALGPNPAQPGKVEREEPLQKAKRSPQLPQLEPEKANFFQPLGEKSAMLLRVPDLTLSTA